MRVEHMAQNGVRIIGAPLLPGNYGQQRLFAPVGVCGTLTARRHLPDVRRQVAEETPDHVERIRLVLRQIVDNPGLVDLGAFVSQFLLGDVVAEGCLDHRRPARKYLADALHHEAEMGQACFHCRQAGDRPQDGRHNRHGGQQLLDSRGAGGHRNVRAADLFERTHAAAGGVQ